MTKRYLYLTLDEATLLSRALWIMHQTAIKEADIFYLSEAADTAKEEVREQYAAFTKAHSELHIKLVHEFPELASGGHSVT